MAACLGYLILNQQDAAGLITFDKSIRQFVPARSAPSQLMRIVQILEESQPREESGIAPVLHEVAERIDRRGLVIIISDLIDDPAPLIESLHHLRHMRHEVILMQVMSNDELKFPFKRWSLFENLERIGQRLRLDPALARQTYLQNLDKHQKTIRDAASRLHLSHVLLNTSEPFDEALTMYVGRR